MKTIGFVLVSRTGAYGCEHRKQTHVGEKVGIQWVHDLNQATVFGRVSGERKKMVESALNSGAVKVPATVERIVLLGKEG